MKRKENRSQRDYLSEQYQSIRQFTERLCEPLIIEDYIIQSMPDVSPTRWHIAHVSWFFETFVLNPYASNYKPINPKYKYLFNSYYIAVGERYPRPLRGLLSRPNVHEIFEYRKHIDENMMVFINQIDDAKLTELTLLIETGLHHEQQHQELMLTDIKHVFSVNPLYPVYREVTRPQVDEVAAMKWIPYEEGIFSIGHGDNSFCYDNETPRHRVFLEPFEFGSRLITNGEYMDFMEDDGYKRADLWLSMGWDTVNQNEWESPLYWLKQDGEWYEFSLNGLQKVNPHEPVCHVSYYEADAFARWKDARLPTEAEWEVVAQDAVIQGNFVDDGMYHTAALIEADANKPAQMYGDAWEWTQSSYSPYPGYKAPKGAIGEYNGKFMCNQFVLKGGSCATTLSHIRPTYRNFFYPPDRWQFMGIRLVKDVLGS